MRTRGRVRPSKPLSALAMLVGILFVLVGVFFLIPHLGWFGIIWTLVAGAITAYHALNVFSERGVAHEVVDFDISTVESARPPAPNADSAEQRLKNLESLREKGLLRDDEYEMQRRKILDQL